MPNSDANDRMVQLEAAAFRQLLSHLRQRQDVSNIDMMGWTGFCRNCLADWLVQESVATDHPLTVEEARIHVYGEHYVDFKARQKEATPEQIARMNASIARNRPGDHQEDSRLDKTLAQGFPASDPPKN